MQKNYTLLFIQENDSVLLGLKKRGFGVNKWNGFGGKVEPNEPIEEATVREMMEESNVMVNKSDLIKVGVVHFIFQTPPLDFYVHVFKTTKFTGEVKESEEMRPKWFKITEIPYENMWQDDAVWYPYMFADKQFEAKFIYENEKVMLDNYEIIEI